MKLEARRSEQYWKKSNHILLYLNSVIPLLGFPRSQ